MGHMGRGWGPGTFQKTRRSSGGLTGAQAEQKVSLSPHPREIPERSQLVKLWFPVVFLSHMQKPSLFRSPLPTEAAPPSCLREVGWVFVGNPDGGMWLLAQVPVAPAPHLGSTPKSSPHFWGWASSGGASPACVAGPHSPESIPINQDRNEPAFNRWERQGGGGSAAWEPPRRRGNGLFSLSGGGKGEKEGQWRPGKLPGLPGS